MAELPIICVTSERWRARAACGRRPRNFTCHIRRSGRNLVLTDAGQLVLNYADEIFAAGRELTNAVKRRPGKHPVRLNIGLTDAFAHLLAFEIFKGAFRSVEAPHIICREAEIALLVNALRAHRLDIVLADEPASSTLKAKTFNHRLGRSRDHILRKSAISDQATSRFPPFARRRACAAANHKYGDARGIGSMVRQR